MAVSLKVKIMGGYLALVLIITAVGAWAIFIRPSRRGPEKTNR